jgi:hypothetical protein
MGCVISQLVVIPSLPVVGFDDGGLEWLCSAFTLTCLATYDRTVVLLTLHLLQLGIPTANIPPSGLAAYPDLESGV